MNSISLTVARCVIFLSIVAASIIYAATPHTFKTYPGTVTTCYDADTCTVNFFLEKDIDFGFGIQTKVTHQLNKQKVRLYGIDAWEMRGDEKEKGKVARDWMREQVIGQIVRIDVLQKRGRDAQGKYGRWLVVLWRGSVNLNEKLVELGHAEKADY